MTAPARGLSTLELLLAFAVLALSLTAVVSLFAGNQAAGIDAAAMTDALGIDEAMLVHEETLATSDFLSASSSTSQYVSAGRTYDETSSVLDRTPCEKSFTAFVGWNESGLRKESVDLSALFVDPALMQALGDDCPMLPNLLDWTHPSRFASDTLGLAGATALDALGGFIYIGERASPYLAIVATKSVQSGQTSGLSQSLGAWNGGALGAGVTAMDAVRLADPSTGTVHTYIYATLNSTTTQLAVIDASDPSAPTVVAKLGLPCVNPTGTSPEGWYLFVYGNRLYLVTRYTKGPELHIFTLTTPSAPIELPTNSSGVACTSHLGFELGDTTEQLVARDQYVGGTLRRFLYLATDEDDREVRVLDVTDPAHISEVADVDLPGTTDAQSLYLLGTTLYVGRLANASGPELYAFDASNPPRGLTPLGTAEVGASVLTLNVAGGVAYLATGKAGQSFQTWNVADLTHMTHLASFNAGTLASSGLDYDASYVYLAASTSPAFQMLSAP